MVKRRDFSSLQLAKPFGSCWPKPAGCHIIAWWVRRRPVYLAEMNRTSKKPATGGYLLAHFLWALGLLSTACQSTDKPASASFASVVITGNTPGQIGDTSSDVFREDGYKVAEIVEAIIRSGQSGRVEDVVFRSAPAREHAIKL